MATFYKNVNIRTDAQNLSQFVSSLSLEEQRMLSKLLNDEQKREHREHPRTPCSIITEYSFNDQTFKGTMKNISLGGFFQITPGLIRAIRHIKPDLIFENPFSTLTPRSYLTWIGAKMYRIPTIYFQVMASIR